MTRPSSDDGGASTPSLGRLVWNGRSRRLRMPLRIVAGLGLWAVIGISVSRAFTVVFRGPSPLVRLGTSHMGNVAVAAADLVVGAIATPVAIYLAARYVDRRWARDLGFRFDRRWWGDLAFGFALGGALMTAIFLIQLSLGWITVTDFFVVGGVPAWTFPFWFALSVLGYTAGSVVEELLYRGFLLTNFAEGFQVGPLGPRGAVAVGTVLTSGGFALGHATALNATPISTLSIGLAGVFLALGYALTGELALPIGVHIAWNVFEGNLYGFPISGTTTTSIVGIEQGGPDRLTGGAFGPEAGLLGVGAILLGIAATYGWARYYRGTRGLAAAISTPELRG